MQKTKIYTFWQGYMPPYIRLCLETFKNLGYEFVVLDHSNLNDYLSPSDFPIEKLGRFPPAAQGDIIACYMMNRYRGYFIDADTIFLGKINHLEDLLDSHELVMIGDEKVPFCHAAFILSSGDSVILQEWETKIRGLLAAIENSEQAENQSDGRFVIKSNSFGNPLLHPIIGKHLNKVKILDKDLFLPENRSLKDFSSEKRNQAYKDFYFTEEVQDIPTASFLILHNSWSPEWYKRLSIEEIKKDKLFISRLLMQAIGSI
ncbi:capsular polysaccharide synthesis protein [Algoriphagus sp. A40]|uniref:capsular polysaccharide synthesis protein n=1 Tax=Algoriphagus sp. A40 TaxID=1945863 RepID=UPI000987BBF4|nr:capsular polysaccharide synthesis protein [Algoriphagus sp. A40]OOG78673.1 hypothetical protein B0E43_00910 [Algoriphagus sp. A40]